MKNSETFFTEKSKIDSTINHSCIQCKVRNLHREGKFVYVGIFDMNERLEKTRKILREKQHLKQLIEEDIRQLERDVQAIEEMIVHCGTKVTS